MTVAANTARRIGNKQPRENMSRQLNPGERLKKSKPEENPKSIPTFNPISDQDTKAPLACFGEISVIYMGEIVMPNPTATPTKIRPNMRNPKAELNICRRSPTTKSADDTKKDSLRPMLPTIFDVRRAPTMA